MNVTTVLIMEIEDQNSPNFLRSSFHFIFLEDEDNEQEEIQCYLDGLKTGDSEFVISSKEEWTPEEIIEDQTAQYGEETPRISLTQAAIARCNELER